MAYNLIPENVYHPYGGMNPDSNGITARPDEAVDIVNLTLTSSTVTPRPGTAPIEDIEYAADVTVSDAEWSGANETYPYSLTTAEGKHEYEFVGGGFAPVRIRAGGSQWEIYDITGGQVRFTNSQIELDGPPPDGWERIVATNPIQKQPSNLKITPWFTTIITEPILKYWTYIHPVNGSELYAFTATKIYKYDAGKWEVATSEVFNVNQWSITNYIDKDKGATVVAAGSLYTRPTEAYGEQSSRVLLYLDPAAAATNVTFVSLQLTSDQLASDVYPDISTAAGPPHIYTGTVTNTTIIEGTTYFTLEGVGVIAITGLNTFDNGGNRAQYLLSIDNTDEFVEGPNSWIELDTGNFSLEFTAAQPGTQDLVAYYSYKVNVTYKPLYVQNFYNSLVLGNTYEADVSQYFPWRLRWTQPNDMFTLLRRDYQELALSDISPILGMLPLETSASSSLYGPLYIYKHNSIIRATYNQRYNLDPQVPVPLFEFEIAFSEGIEAANTIVANNGVHMFLGRNDVYMFNGYERISMSEDKQVGNTTVQRTLFDRLNLNNLHRAFGLYDELNRRYLLFFPEYGKGDYPEQALVYDIDRSMWSRITVPPTSAAIDADIVTTGTIAQLAGQIQNLEGTIDDLTGNESKLVVLAMTNISYYFSTRGTNDRAGVYNDPVDHYFISRDFMGQTLEENDRYQKVIVEGIGSTIEMGWNGDYSTDPAEFHDTDTLKFSTIYRRETYHLDVVTTAIRFLVRIFNTTQFRWMQPLSVKQEFTNE